MNVEGKSKKIILLHCFPTPYRNHLFESLQREAEKRKINFEVHFFEKTNKSRPNWVFNSHSLKYKHTFWKPIFKKGTVLHFNFGLLRHIFQEKPDLIISGGVWSSINSILLILYTRLTFVAWDETNRFDFGSQRKTLKPIKRFLVNKLTYFAVPGRESVLFYADLLTKQSFERKVFMQLPNLVDESLFSSVTDAAVIARVCQKYRIGLDQKIIYWPARFIKDKGIENFIQFLDRDQLQGWLLILVGHGPLQSQIEDLVAKRGIQSHVLMLKSLPYDEAIHFYKIADLLIMPSISDSNPLSVIEAIHSSLPILISNRVGNIHEVLKNGINGVSVDPFNRESVKSGINIMFRKSKEELKEMGKKSKELANANFNTSKVITRFFDDLAENNLV